MAETKEMSGALFRVGDRKSEKHPHLSGRCLIAGVHYRVAAWMNEVQRGERAGQKYLVLRFTPEDEQAPSSNKSTPLQADDVFSKF